MNNLNYSNLNYHLYFHSHDYPFHQFSTANYVQQTTRTIVYTNNTNYQPPISSPMIHRSVPLPVVYNCQEETAILGGTFNYTPIRLYTQPTYEENLEAEEQIGRVDYRLLEEETAIIGDAYDDIGEAYDDWPNSSHSYNQPTYEEYLELGERIGRVGSRLSEETIMGHLKITSYDAASKRILDKEADICVICQGEYEIDELIGGLQCRHEYHVECVNRWLQQHNSCPICKAAAVSPNGY